MQIQIKLMGLLRDKAPAGGSIELPDGGTIEDALRKLDIPVDGVQVFTVNGQLERDRHRALAPNDELAVVPPVGGGSELPV